jgi:hypothetical protein
MAEKTLIDTQRQDLLALLDRYLQDGVDRVNWLTTQDDHVCRRCAAREQRVLTIAQAVAELNDEFCESSNPERGCRCTLTVVESKFDEMP